MDIRYAKIAVKSIQGYKARDRKKIREQLQTLTGSQSAGKKGIFRLRVEKFRVKCEFVEDEEQVQALHIIDVDSRGDIYRPGHIPIGMYQKAMLLWDKDFSRLTFNESRRMKLGRKQLFAGEYYVDSEIDWDNLDKLENLD